MSASPQVQAAADNILKAFETATVPKAMANLFLFDHVDVPSLDWSWRNRLLAAIAGHFDARGYRQWESVGRHVRKGEHAFYILAPMTRKAREDVPDKDIKAGDPLLFGFKAVAVFGYDQTEGVELPHRDVPPVHLERRPLQEVAESWGITVSAARLGAGVLGRYRPSLSTIELAVDNLSTWAHELVHAADHRLGALFKASKVSAEVVAELGATILLEVVGLEDASDRGGAFDYIGYFAKVEGRSPFELASDLIDRTCRCVDLICSTARELPCKVLSMVRSGVRYLDVAIDGTCHPMPR